MEKKPNWYPLKNALGADLRRAVIYIGYFSSFMAILTFIFAVLTLKNFPPSQPKGKQLIPSVLMFTGLVISPMSIYQLVISLLLVYEGRKFYGNKFFSSVWFTSHITILMIYGVLFLVRGCASIYYKHYSSGIATIILIVCYEVVYISAEIVVASYMRAVERQSLTRFTVPIL